MVATTISNSMGHLIATKNPQRPLVGITGTIPQRGSEEIGIEIIVARFLHRHTML